MAAADLTQALQRAREIEITVTGRRSGRAISNPVWFVEERDTLYLLPVRGSDTQWYRNVLKNPAIRVAADGAELSTDATPVTDPARVMEVEQKFRAKYGDADVERYYPKRDVAVEIPVA
ncbi:MAG: nitroreductase family deazaflavin-dependent oxidoreductase [Actinobacteria bacterium]|nr:MAG: nitroreductase family deazaflavin-dependent oxidoreductase [Actinomycetota bacterium]